MVLAQVKALLPHRPMAHRTPDRKTGRAANALVAVAVLVALGACGGARSSVVRTSAPVPNAGTLFFATGSFGAPPLTTTIHALSAGDGKPRWQTQLAGTSLPVVFNGTTLFLGTVPTSVYGPPTGGTLTAVTAATGAKAWQHDFDGQVPLPIAATADTLFITLNSLAPQGGPKGASIAALHASDGTVAWTADLSGGLAGQAVLSGTTLYAITVTGASATATTPPTFTMIALGISDGKPLWQQTLAGPPMGAFGPMLSGGAIYLAEEPITQSGGVMPSTTIEAVKASDGTRLWQTTSQPGTVAMNLLANADGVFYTYTNAGGPGGGLAALHASDGTAAWQQATANTAPTLLAADGGIVYAQVVSIKTATSPSSTLRAFDAHSGAVTFEHPFPTLPLQFLPKGTEPGILAGGVLYLITAGIPAGTAAGAKEQLQSVVLALRASDGTALWNRALDGNPASLLFYVAP